MKPFQQSSSTFSSQNSVITPSLPLCLNFCLDVWLSCWYNHSDVNPNMQAAAKCPQLVIELSLHMLLLSPPPSVTHSLPSTFLFSAALPRGQCHITSLHLLTLLLVRSAGLLPASQMCLHGWWNIPTFADSSVHFWNVTHITRDAQRRKEIWHKVKWKIAAEQKTSS